MSYRNCLTHIRISTTKKLIQSKRLFNSPSKKRNSQSFKSILNADLIFRDYYIKDGGSSRQLQIFVPNISYMSKHSFIFLLLWLFSDLIRHSSFQYHLQYLLNQFISKHSKRITQRLYPNRGSCRFINNQIFASKVFSSVCFRRFRHCIILINIIAYLLGILQFIKSFELLLIVRLCQGLCVGAYSVLAPLVIKELAPLKIKGTMVSLTQLLICSGIFFGYLLTYTLAKVTGDKSGKSFMHLVFILP